MVGKNDLNNFRRYIRGLEREIAFQQKEDTSCCGVSLAHCYALVEISCCGEISVTELAEILELDKSTLSRTVESMVASGLVERSGDKSDRRRAVLKLTGEGITTMERINKFCDDYYRRMFKLIDSDKHHVIFEAVELLANAMKKLRVTESGGNKKTSCCAEK